MSEYTFYAKIISGHRLTIRSDIYDHLNLKEGMEIKVAITPSVRQLALQNMDVML